jgi:putative glutamine amidotransferase
MHRNQSGFIRDQVPLALYKGAQMKTFVREFPRMSRPLLGIVACTRDVDDEKIHRVIDRYLRAPARWSGVDVVLVPALGLLADQRNLAARLDGLLLTGSTSNLESWRYGGRDDHGPFDPDRDLTSLTLASAMLDTGKPVFGICRGFQELNVVFGGTLQHLSTTRQAIHHAPAGVSIPEMFAHAHTVRPVAGGVLARALGEAAMTVNSVHFQGVQILGSGLSAEALAPDGLVEAFSTRVGTADVLAVQWHPEWDADTNPQSRWFFTQLGRAMGAQPALQPADAA